MRKKLIKIKYFMKKYALIILALVFALAGCKKSANSGHETKTAKDANGYNYEYVENDPSGDRKSTRLNSSHIATSRMPSSA